MTDRSTDAPTTKVTRARAVTVGAADPAAAPRHRAPKAGTETSERSAENAGETPPATIAAATPSTSTPSTDTVTVRGDGLATAEAAAIEVTQGGIGSATATDLAVSQGGIGFARGEVVSVEMGAIGIVMADRARLSQGVAQAMIAREATFEQGILGTLVAERVTVRQPSLVGLLLANRVDGDVRTLLDWRGALAAGAAIGMVVGLLRRR
jgi:hypothetical protein